MSTFKVEVVKIDKVLSHPNADKLDIVTMQGKDWNCITAKGNYVVGDLAVYFPIDSILTDSIEKAVFSNSKVSLNDHRIRTIKLRGIISQGLVVKPGILNISSYKPGEDLTELLQIKKYETVQRISAKSSPMPVKKEEVNPLFKKYTGIENAKNFNNIFEEGELVVVNEKIHGTSFRASYAPIQINTFMKKVKKFFKLLPEYEFVFGSHNVQLSNNLLKKENYTKNIYAEIAVKYNLQKILKPGEAVYGEIYGDTVQKGYHYGIPGKRDLVLFDVMYNGKYLSSKEFNNWIQQRKLPVVPKLYEGPFNKDIIKSLVEGDSVLAPSQKIREGIVAKPSIESSCYIGRKMLKYISDNYLLKNQDNETNPH